MKSRLLLSTLPLLCVATVVWLSPAANATSANISHPYKSTTALQAGSLVSLDTQRSGYVVAANTVNGTRLIGVVVSSQDSLVAVDAHSGMAQVAIRGTANTLVSNLGGDIQPGDPVSVSPFNGVGMKSSGSYPVIGTAETSFSTHSAGVISQDVTDKDGDHRSIAVGYIRLAIAISTATTPVKELSGFQKLGHSLTGKTLPTYRVVISLIVALMTVVVVFTLLYASVFGTVASINRNPMAKRAVLGSFASVVTMAGLTILVGTTLIYFMLH